MTDGNGTTSYSYVAVGSLGALKLQQEPPPLAASATSAPAYAYDPYGTPLQATAPLTDFNYAGMFANLDSGLYLTRYRAYDPVAGRWLSRDPISEASDRVGNLYRYVDGNPLSQRDPNGNLGFVDAVMGGLAGGLAGASSAICF